MTRRWTWGTGPMRYVRIVGFTIALVLLIWLGVRVVTAEGAEPAGDGWQKVEAESTGEALRGGSCWKGHVKGKMESALGTDLAYGGLTYTWCQHFGGTRLAYLNKIDPFRVRGSVTDRGDAAFWEKDGHAKKRWRCTVRENGACKRLRWKARFPFKQDWPNPGPTIHKVLKVTVRCSVGSSTCFWKDKD